VRDTFAESGKRDYSRPLLSGRVEGRRAGCRWRVSSSVLSIAEWIHNATVATFPAPATSNAACGFPALRFPARFMPRVMGPFYVAAVVKPPLSLSCLFLSLHNLQEDHTTSFPHTGRTESVQRSSRRGGCPGPLLAGAASAWPLALFCRRADGPSAVRPVCWWLRQAWDPLAPNDLLYMSAAPAPSTQSCMRPEAPGEARA
jgi:hypothetical protein